MGVTTDVNIVDLAKGQGALPPEVLDIQDFFDRVIAGYNEGGGPETLPADLDVARSLIPAGTGAYRNFSYISPQIPAFEKEACVGCMECVTECPDSAILAKVVEPDVLSDSLDQVEDTSLREFVGDHFVETTKYYKAYERKGQKGGLFSIVVDPTKCKGCGVCVAACGEHHALHMVEKQQGDKDLVPLYQKTVEFFRKLPETPKRFISERVLADMMLAEHALLYVGGAGSCAGCGEATSIRMMLAATGFVYGRENIGIVAATGCNTVYGSTYPYNPFLVPWTNSLFENAATDAMGVRLRWNQLGWGKKRLWVFGGDGAMYDIGFQALSRMLASGMDIKVLILDTQVYSNTGGQTSTSSFTGQDAKMSAVGKAIPGKTERRKEIARIAMMHPNTFVAQTTPAHINHFYRAIMDANSFDGPAVVVVYTACMPEHGIGDDEALMTARLAVDSRTYPLVMYDPRKGDTIRERLSLKGNPAMKDDWYVNPKTKEEVNFITFARTQGRFAKNFYPDGTPKEILNVSMQDRLANWHMLQEMAGLR